MEQIKLLIVDDHSVVRKGLNFLLSDIPNFQVIGEAATACEAVEKAQTLNPDIVIMDIRLPDKSGIEACREITSSCPNIRVIMLTSYSDDDLILESISAGAKGYVLKDIEDDEIIRAINVVVRGGSSLDPKITDKVLNFMSKTTISATVPPTLPIEKETSNLGDILSDREFQILKLIALGKTNKEIGYDLGVSDKTIKNYITKIFTKLEISNRTEAAALALKSKIV